MDYNEIKVAVVGAGRWGMNHVKTAASLIEHENIIVCDGLNTTEDKIKALSQKIKFTTDLDIILNDERINAVIIATPAETHFEIAKKCILAGKNVLVEKPITLYLNEAKELEQLATDKGVKLMVGHVLLFHPAILKMKEELENGKLGKLQYIYSNRLNLGAIRSEENILWSFAPHDISVIQFLVGENPTEISAKGDCFVQKEIEDTTITYLQYPNNVAAHIFVSWLHPFKEQRMVVIGEKGMFVFGDTLKDDKLKFFEKGFKHTENGLEKFDNDFEKVTFENKMPLAEEQKHFYESIINDMVPRTNGKHAVGVLEILVKATEKIKNN